MATIPIGLARLIEGIGLDAILLQNRSLSKEQLQRLAGAALLLGTALTVLYLALSVPISLYFQEPQVAAIVSILNLTFVIDALQILPRALLGRWCWPLMRVGPIGPWSSIHWSVMDS